MRTRATPERGIAQSGNCGGPRFSGNVAGLPVAKLQRVVGCPTNRRPMPALQESAKS